MIGGKLMRLSLMLVKSLVFEVSEGKGKTVIGLSLFCSLLARCFKKNECKMKNNCMYICIQ